LYLKVSFIRLSEKAFPAVGATGFLAKSLSCKRNHTDLAPNRQQRKLDGMVGAGGHGMILWFGLH
jgi:hypothetical protein